MIDTRAKLDVPGSSITLRRPTREDLPAIVGLLVDDPLGAFPAQAEAARVVASHRSQGLGAATFQWAQGYKLQL